MAETVHLPGIGDTKREYLLIAGAAALGIVAYAWFKHRSATQSATVDPNAIDPATGLTYAAEAAGSPTGGQYVNPNPVQSVNDQTGTAVQTNQQWTAAVVNDLGNLGLDSGAVSAALAAYLSRQPLSTDQAAIVRQAWAWEGYPPQGPTTFTLSGSGGSTPGGGGGGSSTPPAVPTGLHVTATTDTSISLAWDASTGATGYHVFKDGSSVGEPVGPSWVSVGNAPKSSHSYQVAAVGTGGESARSAAVTGTTKDATATSGGGTSTPAPIPQPAGAVWVETAKFTANNPPWNSTLSGIAAHQGTTVAHLLTLNPSITNANSIPFPGRIRVR